MPIRFRCPGCDGLLSIARRKAGTDVACPKCGELVIVPPIPDDQTEMDLDGPEDAPEVPSPNKEPIKVEAPKPEPVVKSKPTRPLESGGAGVQTVVAVKEPRTTAVAELEKPKPPAPAPVLAPASTKPKKSDSPLFEDPQFEALLKQDVSKVSAEVNGSKPHPAAGSGEKVIPAKVLAASAASPDSQGIFLSRGALTMMVVAGLVLLALAFAAGYLVGS